MQARRIVVHAFAVAALGIAMAWTLLAAPAAALTGRINLVISCFGDPEVVSIINATDEPLSLSGFTLTTINDPRPGVEPFALTGTVAPGGAIRFEAGPAASGNVLTNQFIFENVPEEGARLTTPFGSLEVFCGPGGMGSGFLTVGDGTFVPTPTTAPSVPTATAPSVPTATAPSVPTATTGPAVPTATTGPVVPTVTTGPVVPTATTAPAVPTDDGDGVVLPDDETPAVPTEEPKAPTTAATEAPKETPANTDGGTGGGTITLPDTGSGPVDNAGSFGDPAGVLVLTLAGICGAVAYSLRRRMAA